MTKDEIEHSLKQQFRSLTPKLQVAARYVLNSPTEIAVDSMRSSAAAAKVQPAVMLRLARRLGFKNYQTFRSAYIEWISSPTESLYQRAQALTRRRSGRHYEQALVAEILESTIQNIGKTLSEDNAKPFSDAAKMLSTAKRVYVLGARSLFPAAYYFHYLCTSLFGHFSLLSDLGATMPDQIRHVRDGDILVSFNFHPYSLITSQVVHFAKERNVSIIAITDSVVSPSARVSNICLLAPNGSPSMFPSIVPAMMVAETLAAILIASEGNRGLKQIEDVRAQLLRFNVFVER